MEKSFNKYKFNSYGNETIEISFKFLNVILNKIYNNAKFIDFSQV